MSALARGLPIARLAGFEPADHPAARSASAI